MNYDLLILADEKDYNKVPLCVQQCKQHLKPKPSNIHIVTPTVLPNQPINTISYLDSGVIDIKKEDINYKQPGWILKQLINLFQNITSEFYLSVDADLFFLRDIELFDQQESPKLFINKEQERHAPYFILMNKIYGFEKFCGVSFISDFMMFNKPACRKFFGNSPKEFLNKINPLLHDGALLADYEWYGNFLYHKHPDWYLLQDVKSKLLGQFGPYTVEQLNNIVYSDLFLDYDMVAAHSWNDKTTLEDQR
jgi:hypothetical protein